MTFRGDGNILPMEIPCKIERVSVVFRPFFLTDRGHPSGYYNRNNDRRSVYLQGSITIKGNTLGYGFMSDIVNIVVKGHSSEMVHSTF